MERAGPKEAMQKYTDALVVYFFPDSSQLATMQPRIFWGQLRVWGVASFSDACDGFWSDHGAFRS